ncbi:MAG: M18 family aminopeptidase [Fibrobacterota bacterium]
MNTRETARHLLSFIGRAPDSANAVSAAAQDLEHRGFLPLSLATPWEISPGEKYYVIHRGVTLFAFRVGTGSISTAGMRVIAAHTDSPGLRVKPASHPDAKDKYTRLNTEVYGAPILSTWLDRPLSLAGQVFLRGETPFTPRRKIIDFARPLLTIPNIAIHLNRTVNEGMELNRQKDMQPLLSTLSRTLTEINPLEELISNECSCSPEDIVDYDLSVYCCEEGCLLGAQEEFISAPRLDDLAMVRAGIDALCDAPATKETQILALFSDEEVGSATFSGAGSPLFRTILEKIAESRDTTSRELQQGLYNSFLISADMAHALHPNAPEKHDPLVRPLLNGGPAVKYSANGKYATDGAGAAIFRSLCEKTGVPVQSYVNRSDITGGSTLGSIFTTKVDIPSVDIGIPMLAMHSARELCGAEDLQRMTEVFMTFYSE